jgi:hypothetical protein
VCVFAVRLLKGEYAMKTRMIRMRPYENGPSFSLSMAYPSGQLDEASQQTMHIVLTGYPGGTRKASDLASNGVRSRSSYVGPAVVYASTDFTPSDPKNPLSDQTVASVLEHISTRRLNRNGMENWLRKFHRRFLEAEAIKWRSKGGNKCK